jgi:hypothetical protein
MIIETTINTGEHEEVNFNRFKSSDILGFQKGFLEFQSGRLPSDLGKKEELSKKYYRYLTCE